MRARVRLLCFVLAGGGLRAVGSLQSVTCVFLLPAGFIGRRQDPEELMKTWANHVLRQALAAALAVKRRKGPVNFMLRYGNSC